MSCIHGHSALCGCGDCQIARCWLREPRARTLIACQIQTGPGMTWTDRTYEVVPASDGQWLIDLGEGALEPRRDWAAVLDWLRSLRPRDVELMEVSEA
jgi:hypothetical protein